MPAGPEPAPIPAPGLIAGIGSIIAGVIGFSMPVLGIAISVAGIAIGVYAIRRGRAGDYSTSVKCGGAGIGMGVLGIVFWVGAILFESYR